LFSLHFLANILYFHFHLAFSTFIPSRSTQLLCQ
jgi:hypothetical protein